MDSIRFSAVNQATFRPEVLNHKTASPFQQNQIQFHIGSAYLSDFTDKGIENFVKKHQPENKDLDINEVKTFIQRVANNAEASKNVTFDLADPQIGLYEDDGIEKSHLQGGFTLSVSEKPLLPKGQATTVRFVDVTTASYDLKEKETEISAHQKSIKETQGKLKDLRSEHGDTKDDLETAHRILGPDADRKLQHILDRQPKITKELEQLSKDETTYKAELAKPDLKPERKTELERILRALPVERKQLQDEQKKLTEQLDDNTGPLLQRTSLNDLHQLKQKFAAESKEIGELEAKIQDELAKLKAVMDRPSPDAKAESPKPETAPAVTAPKPVQTGDGGDPNPNEEAITVGGSVKIEDLKTQSPAHQASRLASLPAAQQKELLAQFSPDERGKILSETETSITRLQAEASSSRRDKQLEGYQTLKTSIQHVNTPAKPSDASNTGAPAPVTSGNSSASTTTTTTTNTTSTTASSGVTLGAANSTVATGTITRKGQPFMHGGQAVTIESFKSLAMEAKFDILMKADSAFLRDILSAMTKEERSQIKTMAQRVVDDFIRDYSSQVNVVNVTQSVDATISGASSTVGSKPTASPEARERYERAQEIIRIINELDGTGSTTQTTQTTQTTNVRGRELRAGEFVYRVKPGDTATSIAKSQLGNEMYNYDIFNEDRNKGLNQAMIQRRGPQVNRYNEDISQYKEYQELVLSRTPAPPPPTSATPRREEPKNPVVIVEPEPVAPTQPVAKVVAPTPAVQAEVNPEPKPKVIPPVPTETKIVVTEEESTPVEPPKVVTPAPVEPAKPEVKEKPVQPPKVVTPTPVEPAVQPKRKTS